MIVFVVDNSWSIHVETSLERAKGVVLELLKDAHIHHDRVAMVAFRHGRLPDAAVVIQPTSSYATAVERLRKLPVSGSTPLPDAIRKAYHLLRQTRIKYENAIPVVVMITDGIPNVSIRPGGDPYEETRKLCRQLLWENVATMIVDTEPRGSDAGRNHCKTMARLSGGRYLTLSQLTRQTIEDAVVSLVGSRSSHRHECF
jgi:magnesium chelatase subunit D